ncbi:hypothetical protein SLA2020_139530 [Shorea laevis]
MALQIHTPPSFPDKPYLPQSRSFLHAKPRFTLRCQGPNVDSEPTAEPSPPKKPAASGQGFGPSSSSSSSPPGKSVKKQKSKGERASVVRRLPVEKPAFLSKEEEAKFEEQRRNEGAFLLTWLGLGGIILVEGIVLAASGFLPEEWDKFLVKYLYPSFTPTVALFLAGTVAYGVSKYLQNEKLKEQK